MPNLVEKFREEVGFLWGDKKPLPPRDKPPGTRLERNKSPLLRTKQGIKSLTLGT